MFAKTLVVLLCASAALAAVPRSSNYHGTASQACAQEGSDSDLLPSEWCNIFYKCFEGQPIQQGCPLGLLYNIDQQYCDWSDNVNCDDRTIYGTSGNWEIDGNGNDGSDNNGDDNVAIDTEGSVSEVCAREGSDGVLLPAEFCNHFYKCSEGKGVQQGCPVGLLYNINQQYCDWPDNVDCGDRYPSAW